MFSFLFPVEFQENRLVIIALPCSEITRLSFQSYPKEKESIPQGLKILQKIHLTRLLIYILLSYIPEARA